MPKTDVSIPVSEIAKTSKNAVSKGPSKIQLTASGDNLGNMLKGATEANFYVGPEGHASTTIREYDIYKNAEYARGALI
ncbi:hypothetical protein [Clostridium sp. UBA6640]|uniref:hypothetical protein n=1 Tax=Clostridium sp. UBA6640 TaxID=1946370 RepID=UPI0025C00A91|nr:hypothetical protein [Clostridium sp. UBA6640]